MDTKTTPQTITLANAMPAPTWHRIGANSCDIAIPEGLVAGGRFQLENAGFEIGAPAAFQSACERYQAIRSEAGLKDDSRAVVRAAHGTKDAQNLDIPALSSYQKKAVLDEVTNNVLASFETGMGTSVHEYIFAQDDEPLVLVAKPHSEASAIVRLNGQDGCATIRAIDVVVEEGAFANLVLAFDSPDGGAGFLGTTLRVFADKGAHLNVSSIQSADDPWIVLDDSGYVLANDAHIEVSHRVLGARFAAIGLRADLWGNDSNLSTTTRYLGACSQERDFNYLVKQRGLRCESSLDASGVLMGASKKTLRGTIDLVHGCKGSVGNERETVLLADEEVENTTIPVILCDEDDVMGNHGATIGHVRPDQRFYLACRGLSEAEIERLYSIASFEEAYLAYDDEPIRESIARMAAHAGIDVQEFATEGEC